MGILHWTLSQTVVTYPADKVRKFCDMQALIL